jgi:hypothetical protein
VSAELVLEQGEEAVEPEYADEWLSDKFQEALALLNKILLGNWHARFAQIEITTLMDINRVMHYALSNSNPDLAFNLKPLVDKRFLCSMDLDLRVCVQWDTDMSDVELQISEPNGALCYSLCNITQNGGFMSRNFTTGYGPIEYVLKNGQPGAYKISVKLFHSQIYASGTTVCVRVFTDYGRIGKERCQVFNVRLAKSKDEAHVATVQL